CQAKICADVKLHIGNDNPRHRRVEVHEGGLLRGISIVVRPKFDVGRDVLDDFTVEINVKDIVPMSAASALFLNTSISGTNKRMKLLGKFNAKGPIKPPSTTPLPIPRGAEGALTYGMTAAAVSPASFPHRLIFE